jgi:hypothetical protein
MSSTENAVMTPAEKYYQDHLKRVSEYQKKNPEKMRAKNKKFNDKVRETDPEKYQQKLEKSRNYYNTITKPKREAEKQKQQIAILFEEV